MPEPTNGDRRRGWSPWPHRGRSDGEPLPLPLPAPATEVAPTQPDAAPAGTSTPVEADHAESSAELAPPAASSLGVEFAEFAAPLERLDRILAHAVDRIIAVYGAEVAGDPFRGLYISQRDASQWSQSPRLAPILGVVGDEPDVLDLIEDDSRLATLARTYGLTGFDLDLVVVALAPEIDVHYERLYAFLQDDVSRRFPTVDLALNILCSTAGEKLARRARLASDAPLVRHDLIELGPDPGGAQPTLLAQVLRLDGAVIRYLLRQGGVDPRLRHVGALVEPLELDADEPPPALERAVAAARAAGEPLVLYFSGPRSGAKRASAGALASGVGAPLLAVDIDYAVAADDDVGRVLKVAFREATLDDAVLYLEPLDPLLLPERASTYRRLADELAQHRGVTVLAGAGPTPPQEGLRGVVDVPFPLPAYAERLELWSDQLADAGVTVPAAQLEPLAGRFRLTPDQIADAVDVACNRARLRDNQLTMPDLFDAARGRSGAMLEGLARKLVPVHEWGQIVLPDESLAQLRELCAHVVQRHRVLDDWGFGRTLSLGKGVSALFAGPSGTGKTMAADIIALELGLDLYKIDLSAVVSKYIGETEKNLERIFSAAENANAILFFDEADALFGKRSEVRDSHDRYANIEIAYLLQRMEQYEGVAILATNLQQNMDEAFVRRLQFVVEFPFPDEEQRAKIWPLLFPAEAECEPDIDFRAFAHRFRVTGGSIRNIVLGAAFLAASEGRPIAESHLLHATRREYVKSGRVLPAEQVTP